MIDTNLRTSRLINLLNNLYHKILFFYAKKGFDVIKKTFHCEHMPGKSLTNPKSI